MNTKKMSLLALFVALSIIGAMIAVEMALIVWIFGVLYQSGKKWIACIVFIILNGIIAPLPFALLLSLPFYISLVPSVLVGSALNGVLALIFIQRFEPFLQKKLVGILNES